MNKPIATIIVALLAAMVLFLFAIPAWRQQVQLQETMAEKQSQLMGSSMYFASIADTLAGLQSRAGQLEKVASALPADAAVAPLVSFLQSKAAENAVTVTSIVFSQESPLLLNEAFAPNNAGSVKDVAFTVNATGSYQGLKNFLAAMDNSARLFEIDALELAKVEVLPVARTQRNQPQYSLKLEVRTRAY